MVTCAQCGTLDPPDQTYTNLCFWCAELQRLDPRHSVQHNALHTAINQPGPWLPNPMRPPERH